jgi:ammonium transporter, Amt family
MTPPTGPALSEAAAALCLALALLTPCAAAGLALINAGLGRSRNAAHSMLSALCVVALAAIVYFAVGFAWQGYAGRAANALMVNGKPWSWIGSEPFLLRGLTFDDSPFSLALVLNMFAVGLAAMIPLGSGAERWRLGAACASTAVLAGWTYPLFAHWVWGGGWLAQLGVNYGLGHGFIDSGGASSIHAVGGLTALAVAWILGPRRGKYPPEGMPPIAIPGHNAAFVLFGCFLTWLGWLGLNSAGAILFSGVETGRITLVALNTTLSAASALVAATAITRSRFGMTDASLCANSWVGGLVAISAGCAVVRPAAAVLIGLAAGAIVVFTVEWLDLRFMVDDPGGAISVHALGGLWGVLAVGLFAQFATGGEGQWLAQVAGIATLLGFVLPLTYSLNWILNRLSPQRVGPEGERRGMDLHELGAGAYPELVSHNEDLR